MADKGINATLINPRFISGVDTELLDSLKQNHKVVVVLEDGSKEGGFGSRVAQAVGATGMKCLSFGLEKKFVDRYNPDELEKTYHLTVPQIVEKTLNALKEQLKHKACLQYGAFRGFVNGAENPLR